MRPNVELTGSGAATVVRENAAVPLSDIPAPLQEHPDRDTGVGWKHHRNNLRLLLQPYVCSCLLIVWLPIGVVSLWFIYRIARGWLALNDGRSMYV